jgi:hypothetical protein
MVAAGTRMLTDGVTVKIPIPEPVAALKSLTGVGAAVPAGIVIG